MASPLQIKTYINLNWLVKLSNERTVETVANQSFDTFRRRINRKFMPIYQEANEIEKPTTRRAKQKQIKGALTNDVLKFFGDYRNKTLDSVVSSTVAAKRLQYQFLEERETRRLRAPAKQVKDRAERRELQLGRGTKADTRTQSYRHKGSSAHVLNKLIAGVDREAKKITDNASRQRFEKRTQQWVKTVARTLAQGAVADGDLQAIKETFNEYRYVAVLDEATTERCDFLDGQVFATDDAEGVRPPQHFNCRSELQPKTKDKQRDKALANATQTKFDKWLKAQPEQTQKLVVGKGKFSAYKAGKYRPPPRWNEEKKYYVDKKTGMPVVPSKENKDRIAIKTKLINVEFQ